MFAFRQHFGPGRGAWISPADSGLIHAHQGFRLNGPLEDGFGFRLHSRWSIENTPAHEVGVSQLLWGNRWLNLLWFTIRGAVGVADATTPAPAILQAVPAGDFAFSVGTWEGPRGMVSGPGGLGMAPEPETRLRGGLILRFGADGYVFLARELGSRDLGFSDRVIAELKAPGGPAHVIAARDVDTPFVRLALRIGGGQLTLEVEPEGQARSVVWTGPAPAVSATRFGVVHYGDESVPARSGIAFYSFEVEPQTFPDTRPEILFDAAMFPGTVDWDLGSFAEDVTGTGSVEYQVATDPQGTTWNGSWLTAGDLRALGVVSARSLRFRARLVSTGVEQVLLRGLSVDASSSQSVPVLTPTQAMVAFCHPREITLSWPLPQQPEWVRSTEILRRERHDDAYMVLATVAGSASTFSDVTAQMGHTYDYAVRWISLDGRLGASGPPLGVPAPIGGVIDRDLTLEAAHTPHLVTRTTRIAGAGTPRFTLEPGVILRFGRDAALVVGDGGEGTLHAVGTEDRPIVFTALGDIDVEPFAALANAFTPTGEPIGVGPGSWPGLQLGPRSIGSRIEHASIRYAGSMPEAVDGAITLMDATPRLGRIRIEACAGGGVSAVYTTGSPALQLEHVTIADLEGAGIFIGATPAAQARLELRSTVIDRAGGGVKLAGCTGANLIEDCAIVRSLGIGIELHGSALRLVRTDVDHNRLAGLVADASPLQIEATATYWGAPDGPSVDAAVTGGGDFVGEGVDFTPFRGAPHHGGGSPPPAPTIQPSSYPYALRGLAEPAARILLSRGGVALDQTTADIEGAFRFWISDEHARSSAELELTTFGRDGNTSPLTRPPPSALPEPSHISIVEPRPGAVLHPGQDFDPMRPGVQLTVRVALSGGARLDRTIVMVNRGAPSEVRHTLSTAAELVATLVIGDNTIEAVTEDDLGRRTFASPITVTLDASIPIPPVWTAPANGTETRDAEIGFRGTAAIGTTVELLDRDQVLTQFPVDGAGAFAGRYRFSTDGHYQLALRAVDAQGRASAETIPRSILVDTRRPWLAIASPPDGVTTNATSITVTGRFEDDNLDDIVLGAHSARRFDTQSEQRVEGARTRTTTVGSFELPDVDLQEGLNRLIIEAADALGNVAFATLRVTRQTRPPAIAALVPPTGTITRDDVIVVSGQLPTGVDVEVQGRPVLPGVGGLSWTATVPLSPGRNEIQVVARDVLGNAAIEAIEVIRDMSRLYLDQITPDRGTPGDLVTVRGSGFVRPAADNRVGFNHLEAAATSVNDEGTLLEVPIPEGATPGPAYVRTPAGISNTRDFSPAVLTSLLIVPSASEISIVGGTTELLCIGGYDSGASREVTARARWTSSDPATATVQGGVVVSSREGQTQIGAEYLGLRATSQIVVEERDLSVLLMLDVSGSMASRERASAPSVLDNAKRAAHALLAQLGASDRVALASFSTQVTSVHSHVTTHALIRSGITQLAAGGQTAVYDAMATAAQLAEQERQAHPQNAHSILVLSDGVDNASSRRLADAIAEINRVGIPAYFVYVDGYAVPGGVPGSGAVGDANTAYDSLAMNVLDVDEVWRRQLVSGFDRYFGTVVVANDPWHAAGFRPGDVILQWTAAPPAAASQHRGTLTYARPLGFVTQPGSTTSRTARNPLEEAAQQTSNQFYRTANASALPSIFNDILTRSRVNPIRLRLVPDALTIASVGQQAQVQALADYSNGTQDDVTTTRSQWVTADRNVVEIVRPGTLRSTGPGRGSIAVFMQNGLSKRVDVSVASAPVIGEVVPSNPVAGSEILIRGAGFSTNPSANIVELNGSRLPVRGATARLLVAQLLPTSVSGDVTVTVNSVRSGPVPLTVVAGAPSTDVVRAIAMNESALLFWEHPASGLGSAAGYLIYRVDPSGSYIRINAGPIADTIFRDGGLTNGVTYRYRLHLVDASGDEVRFGDVVTVTPERFDITFKMDHMPTFGASAVPVRAPIYLIEVADAQGQPVTGLRVHIESEGGLLQFDQHDPWTDHQGRALGSFALAPGVAINQNRFVQVSVFAGQAADLLQAGPLPAGVREQIVGAEIQVHGFTGDYIAFSARIRAFPGLTHLASKAITFKVPVIDARLQLALEDFFIQIRNDREVVGLVEQRLLDTSEGRAQVLSGTRTGSMSNLLLTMVGADLVHTLESKPLVVDLVIGLIPLGDSVDIGTEVLRSYVTGESPRKSVMVLSGIGLAMDLAEISGVGTPAGVVGNAIVVVARRVVRLVPPIVLRMLGSGYDSMKNFIRYTATYVRNPVP